MSINAEVPLNTSKATPEEIKAFRQSISDNLSWPSGEDGFAGIGSTHPLIGSNFYEKLDSDNFGSKIGRAPDSDGNER